MEETKQSAQKEPLSYEKLKEMAGNLYQQNQQLVGRIQQLEEALNDSEFNKMSFLISMLFKVVESSDKYSADFVVWCIETIEQSLMAFAGKSEATKPNEETKEHNEA